MPKHAIRHFVDILKNGNAGNDLACWMQDAVYGPGSDDTAPVKRSAGGGAGSKRKPDASAGTAAAGIDFKVELLQGYCC